jgi:hypothetical protein
MAVISKGQTFATGDQVTALKLNNLADNATFASGAVDNVSTQLSSGAIIVKDGGVTTAKLNDNAVTTAKIANNNVTTAKIADANVTFAKLTDVIDDDTMATASATKLATSESIKAYVTAMRPKFVSLTGGSTDLSKTTTSVSTVDYTYNIADFTSSDPDFATNKIVALIISSFTSSSQGANIVQARLPDEVFTGISRTSADSTADFTQDSSTTTIPINSGQESTVIRHIVTDSQTSAAQSTIRGAIIQPGL